MHVCMYACMHVCMYACTHVCMYVCICRCIYRYVFKCKVNCLHRFKCMHACTHVCTYRHMQVRACLYTGIVLAVLFRRCLKKNSPTKTQGERDTRRIFTAPRPGSRRGVRKPSHRWVALARPPQMLFDLRRPQGRGVIKDARHFTFSSNRNFHPSPF